MYSSGVAPDGGGHSFCLKRQSKIFEELESKFITHCHEINIYLYSVFRVEASKIHRGILIQVEEEIEN